MVEPAPNILIRKFEVCNSEKLIKFAANISTKGDFQFADIDLTMPVDLDANYAGHLYVEKAIDDLTYLPGLNIREKYACKAASKYLGEPWYAAEKAANIPVGVCPLPKGHYIMKDYRLDFSQFPIQQFPAGKVKLTLNVNDKRTKKSVLCLLAISEIVK